MVGHAISICWIDATIGIGVATVICELKATNAVIMATLARAALPRVVLKNLRSYMVSSLDVNLCYPLFSNDRAKVV